MKKTAIICIVVLIVNIIYTIIEPAMLINEIYNSIVQQTKSTTDIYKITNNIAEINIYMMQKTSTHNLMFNTDNIIINNSIHLKNIYIIIISAFCITSIHIIGIKLTAALYLHEINKIKKIFYTVATSITIAMLYYIEITTNTLVKKNFNSTEILNITMSNFTVKEYVIVVLLIAVYYILIKNKDLKKRTTKYKIQTKYTIWLTYIIFINIYAQYSANESLLILIYAESIYQIINASKNIEIYNK